MHHSNFFDPGRSPAVQNISLNLSISRKSKLSWTNSLTPPVFFDSASSTMLSQLDGRKMMDYHDMYAFLLATLLVLSFCFPRPLCRHRHTSGQPRSLPWLSPLHIRRLCSQVLQVGAKKHGGNVYQWDRHEVVKCSSLYLAQPEPTQHRIYFHTAVEHKILFVRYDHYV